jgi:hypothetical protein
MVDATGLTQELQAAGIQIGGCNSLGEVWDMNNIHIESRPDVAAVIAAHNAQAWEDKRLRSLARKLSARTQANLSEQLRTMTPQQAVDYIETNVTSLATAKTVLKIMARIIIAMRDEIWPDLPE